MNPLYKTGHNFSNRLNAVPKIPGVYLMRGKDTEVLYVGKSSSLQARLKQYFGVNNKLQGKTKDLVKRIYDFEYIVAESEQEALLLENNLIKRYLPRFNARLKDDKSYPYIKVDLSEEFPRIYITRKTNSDGARYFGPFASAGSVRKTLDLLNRLFPYRTCTKKITGKDERPCLEYYINRCVAPCTGFSSEIEYKDVIDQVIMFLEGKTKTVVSEIRFAMKVASENLAFERAAVLRDRLEAIEKVYQGQKVAGIGIENIDAMAATQFNDQAWVEVFFIRQGNLIGRDNFIMSGISNDPNSRTLEQFIQQFYDTSSYIPPKILVSESILNRDVLQEWLKNKRKGAVSIIHPQRGQKFQLIKMVAENARQSMEQRKIKLMTNAAHMEGALILLEEALALPKIPKRIECYDVSHIQGTNVVASMSVFENGKPKNAEYRRFRMKHTQNNDDFSSIKEVIQRRFTRLSSETSRNQSIERGSSFKKVPDLVLIDGGKGQLSAAVEILYELGLTNIPIASIAKKEELIFLPDTSEPIALPSNSPAFFLVQRARDEAHRFAITYHRKLRSNTSRQSALDLIPGIGPKKKKSLLRRFGSLQQITQASTEQISTTPGMTMKLAKRIKEYIG